MIDARNTISDDFLSISIVDDFSIFKDFYCYDKSDSDDLDEFIHYDVERHVKDKISVCYVVNFTNSNELKDCPIAFITLQNDAIRLEIEGYPYKSSPAVKIGRFGVDKTFQNNGIGTHILSMIKKFMCTDNRTGCRYITLDAYNKPEIIDFYIRKNGFRHFKTPSPTKKHELLYFDLLSAV